MGAALAIETLDRAIALIAEKKSTVGLTLQKARAMRALGRDDEAIVTSRDAIELARAKFGFDAAAVERIQTELLEDGITIE